MSTFAPPGSSFGAPGSTFGELLAGPPVVDISAAVYDRAGTLLADLASSHGRKWRDPLNEAGAGSLTLQNDDPDLASCDFGNVVTFAHRGIDRWSMFVRRHDRNSRAQGEEHDQVTTVSGTGLASVLDEAAVYPEGGAEHQPFTDVRFFNFASPYLDDSSWTTPVLVDEPPFPDMARIPVTGGWPDPDARGIWSRAQEGAGTFYQHPAGTCYFRSEFDVAEITEVSIFILGDDEYELWVDGVMILNYHQPGRIRAIWPYWETQTVNLTLSVGTHIVAVKVTSLPLPEGGNDYNIGELVVQGYKVEIVPGESSPTLTDLIFETNTTDWVALDYPAVPPGFTVGEVMNILLDESQARDTLDDVTRTWTDDDDSGGTAWPISSDITIRVGLSYYSVARQLTEGYMDFDFAPAALEMSMWVQQGEDMSATAVLEGGVNLETLRHAREG